MTARMALAVFEMAGTESRKSARGAFNEKTFTAAALHLMDALTSDPPTLPRASSTGT